MSLPAREILGIRRQHDFDRCAALSLGRKKHLFYQQIGDLLAILPAGDYEHIDGPDEPAGSNRRPQTKDRTAGQLTVAFDDRDTRVGQVDQLTKQADRVHRRVSAGHGTFFRA